jgi:uncharacterized membrane protein
MVGKAAVDRRGRPGKAKAALGRVSAISATATAPVITWFASGQPTLDEGWGHFTITVVSAVVALVAYAIGEGARCLMAWIKQREQTRREQPQIAMFEIAARAMKTQANAAARRLWRVKFDERPTLDWDKLKEIIEVCASSPDDQISRK